MKHFGKVTLIVVLSMMTTGCWVYKPQLADVPLIDHKGDVRVSGSMYLYPVIGGAAATISTGLTNHLAMQLHADYSGSIFYSHIAMGLYHSYGKSVGEFYLGWGYGHADVYLDAYPARANGQYACGFAQYNHGWHLSRRCDMGFAMKVGTMFPDYNGRINDIDENGDFVVRSVFPPKKSTLIEPQVFFRVGGEKVKFQTQVGFTHLFGWPKENVLRYEPLSVSAGISISL